MKRRYSSNRRRYTIEYCYLCRRKRGYWFNDGYYCRECALDIKEVLEESQREQQRREEEYEKTRKTRK